MSINWDEVQKAIFPIKNYAELCHRLQVSLGYRFIREAYNFSLPDLVVYTQKLLGGDARGRYAVYNLSINDILGRLHTAGIQNVVSLRARTASREQLELFVEQSGISAPEIGMVLKYLVYWVIPADKYLSGLVRNDIHIQETILSLREAGIRTNLELLQAGKSASGRKALAENTEISPSVIIELVNRADFSRLPWASKATISNIMGAGYASVKQLANANPEKLMTDFFRYGKSIGKNLKLGNEIENSYRIAQIIPAVLDDI
jgi:hypothetical protein